MEERSKDILSIIVSGVICVLIGFYTINFTFNSSRVRKLERELLNHESTEWCSSNYRRKIGFYQQKAINPFYSINSFKN